MQCDCETDSSTSLCSGNFSTVSASTTARHEGYKFALNLHGSAPSHVAWYEQHMSTGNDMKITFDFVDLSLRGHNAELTTLDDLT